MVIQIKDLKDTGIAEALDSNDVTIRIVEKDGSFNGSQTDIKIPAKSYEMLEHAIVERWLENKKSLTTE
jgi:hypothetical protein